MTNISRLMLIAACSAGIISSTFAADGVSKNKPKTKDVEQTLEEIGGDHFPEDMKISPIGPVETDSTYYHVFSGTLKKGGYHLIIYDNTPAYLGYYLISLEPTGYGEGEIYLYLTSGTEVTIPIDDKGPPEKLRIGSTGMQSTFIKAPVKEEPEEEESVAETSTITTPKKEKKKPEYRPWVITKDGKEINVPSAIFIEIENGNVTIMNAKNGQLATVPASTLSAGDKEYLKDLLQ